VSSRREDAPQPTELEISVFGRGMGECVLCHLGDHQWLMVDSLRDEERRPVAAGYLADMDGEHQIVAVVATHWDDDHTHGMAQVIETHQPAEVWMPIVLQQREIMRFAVVHNKRMEGRGPSGLRDFQAVMEQTEGRKVRRWGMAGRRIERKTRASVKLLSPTDELIDRGLAALGLELAQPGFGEVTLTSNATSIVLWVSRENPNAAALLGADLETGDLGWTAVLDRGHPSGPRGSLVKVPHHGSEDADEPRIWDEMLTEEPVNCVTRYTRLTTPLPRGEDIERLTKRAGVLRIAGATPERLTDSHEWALQLQAATGGRISEARGPVGLIRARFDTDDDNWRVEEFGAVEVAV
jgi:hypothetical protein